MTSHILIAEGISFAYGRRRVLDGVSLDAAQGQFICVMGPNGSGKTTLLRVLLGQLKASAGRIILDGRPLATHRQRELAKLMAYVPQFPQSAFAFSVHEIVLMGRLAYGGMLGLSGKLDLDVARQAMEMTDTLELADRTLEQLSGGEAQRVMIARALAQQPSVLLLDEPTSHLDIRSQLVIYRMMQRVAHSWPMAVVCVSHDINLAGRFADRLVLMRDGRVAARGLPADVMQKDILAGVYDVSIQLVSRPDSDIPMIWAD
jgi:iron complex transport system ATP-binding protein